MALPQKTNIEDAINEMKLHDTIRDKGVLVTRVIGGLVYETRKSKTAVFVPYEGFTDSIVAN